MPGTALHSLHIQLPKALWNRYWAGLSQQLAQGHHASRWKSRNPNFECLECGSKSLCTLLCDLLPTWSPDLQAHYWNSYHSFKPLGRSQQKREGSQWQRHGDLSTVVFHSRKAPYHAHSKKLDSPGRWHTWHISRKPSAHSQRFCYPEHKRPCVEDRVGVHHSRIYTRVSSGAQANTHHCEFHLTTVLWACSILNRNTLLIEMKAEDVLQDPGTRPDTDLSSHHTCKHHTSSHQGYLH